MQINNKGFIFTLDTLSSKECSGWYARKDNADNFLLVTAGGVEMAVLPNVSRPDVKDAGLGPEDCGFSLRFEKPLKKGAEIIFKSASGDELHRAALNSQSYEPDALSDRMIRLVEPFVEMDIAKVRASLMNQSIYTQYKKMFADTLAAKDGASFRQEMVEILADMKTTMHLLCAAYLDYTRYKEPDYLVSLPQFCPDTVESFSVDMKADVTGSNWSAPEREGRWTGSDSRSSVLLPNPGQGMYDMRINVAAEKGEGDLEKLRVFVNRIKTPFTREEMGFPCVLSSRIKMDNSPFLAIHFQFDSSQRQMPEPKKNPRSILITSITFKIARP